jgi:STE24 endopeptidase
LVKQHTVVEIVAILAHEVGHYKKRHVIQSTLISIAHTGVLLFLFSLFLGSAGLYEAFYVEQPSVYVGLLLFGLLYTPIEMVLGVAMHLLSRKNECEADRFAAETAPYPEGMVTALKKLAANNLSNLTPHPFYVFLNYSHPPLLERVKAIEAVRREARS